MAAEESTYIVKRGRGCKEESFHDIRESFQKLLSTSLNISTLIGSGASVPGIPLMGSTFEKLKGADEATKSSQKLLSVLTKYEKARGIPAGAANNIEDFLSWLNSYLEVQPRSRKCRSVRKYVLDEFRKSIDIDYAGSDAASGTLENYLDFVQGLGYSRQVLAQSKSPMFDVVNMFTTNYDLFHELAITRSGYQYTDGFTNGIECRFSTREFHQRPIDLEDRFREHLQPVNPFFRVFKLHGSIDWAMDEESHTVSRLPMAVLAKRDVASDNLLIMPTSSKYAVTQGSPFSDLFREFFNAISVPNSILITSGFSFGDQHISELIEQALMRTDFTLYAFISRRNGDTRNPAQDFADRNAMQNAVFIYPTDNSAHEFFDFGDVARIMKPEEGMIGLGGEGEDEDADL
jgi:hypothetical protein